MARRASVTGRWCGVLLLGLLALPRVPGAAPSPGDSIPRDRALAFDVWRDGERIGSHRILFREGHGRLTVDITIDLAVSVAFIPVFRYAHRNEEVWQAGRLIRMAARTDDDGTAEHVNLVLVGDHLLVDGSKYDGPVAADLLPTTYWREGTVRRSRLVSSQDGRVMAVTVTDRGVETITALGRAVRARHYAMGGGLDLELWYDLGGVWSKLTFTASDGSLIDYRRVVPASQAGGP